MNSRSFICILILVLLAYFLLAQFSLFVCDDYRYAFIQGTNIPIEDFTDVIKSQCYAYVHENGRFFVHVIVQCIASLLGMRWLAFLNTIMFGILVSCIILILNFQNNVISRSKLIPIVVLGLIVSIPHFGNVYIGNIATSVNYLWTSTASVVFLYMLIYFKKSPITNTPLFVFVCLFSFVAGCMQESFSIGISAGLFVYLVLNRKSVNRKELVVSIMYMLGTAIVVLAPGNFLRAEIVNGDTSTTVKILSNTAKIILGSKTLEIFVLLLVYSFLKDRNTTIHFLKENCIISIAIVVNLAFISMVAYTGVHQLTCTELLSFILICELLLRNRFFICVINKRVTCFVLITFLLLLFIPAYYYRSKVYKAYEEMIATAKNSSDGCMIGGEYDRISYGNRNWFVRNFCTTETYADTPLEKLSYFLTKGKNKNYIHTRIPLPKDQICKMAESNFKNNIHSVSINYHNYFYIVTSRKPIQAIIIDYRNILSTLKDKYLKMQSGHSNVDINYINQFKVDDRYYYVLYEDSDHPFNIIEVQ